MFSKNKKVIVLTFLSTLLLVSFIFWIDYKFTKAMDINGDGSLIRYVIINNIQNWKSYSIKYGINQRIFYPNINNASYTDNFYLYSLIALPFYILTHSLFVDAYIFFIHVYLYAIGLFLLGHFFIKNILKDSKLYYILPLIITWLVFLPSFIDKHLQIIFVGPFSFALYFLLMFIKTKRLRFLNLFYIFELIQISVGLYLFVFQIYLWMILIILIFIIYRQKAIKFITEIAKRFKFTHILFLTFYILVLTLLYYQNYQLHIDMNIDRPLQTLVKSSADSILSYTFPNKAGSIYKYLMSNNIMKCVHSFGGEKALFLGIIGNSSLLLISIYIPWKIITKTFSKNTKNLLAIISLLMLLSIYIFSLGPQLKIFGKVLNIYLPYIILYKYILLFRGIRVTARINVFMGPFFLYLIIYLWSIFLNNVKYKFATIITSIIFVMFILIDIIYVDRWTHSLHFAINNLFNYIPPSFIKEKDFLKRESNIYRKLDNTNGNILIELPTTYKISSWDARYLQFHIYHNKFEVNGYSGVFPDNSLNIVYNIYHADNNIELTKVLCNNNIDLILIHKHFIPLQEPEETERLYDILESNYQPVYEDNDHAIFYIDKLTVCPYAK